MNVKESICSDFCISMCPTPLLPASLITPDHQTVVKQSLHTLMETVFLVLHLYFHMVADAV